MQKLLLNRWHGLHMIWAFALLVVVSLALFAYQWLLGLISLILSGAWAYYVRKAEQAFRRDLEHYVTTISHRVKKAGQEVFNEFPLGIVLFNEERLVEWHNPYVARMLEHELLIGQKIDDLLPGLKNKKEKDMQVDISLQKHVYRATVKAEERLIYLYDITEMTALQQRYEEEKLAIGIVMLDNLDEAAQGLDDQARSVMLAKVTGEIAASSKAWHVPPAAQCRPIYVRAKSKNIADAGTHKI